MLGGVRYATLPFLYDDEAARIREQNQAFFEGGGAYRSRAPEQPRPSGVSLENAPVVATGTGTDQG